MMVHSEKKTFQCSQCKSKFKARENLVRHIVSNHGMAAKKNAFKELDAPQTTAAAVSNEEPPVELNGAEKNASQEIDPDNLLNTGHQVTERVLKFQDI